jgi:hypothetical protein
LGCTLFVSLVLDEVVEFTTRSRGVFSVANEQLQYYFNQHIFAAEQSVYAEEGIQAATIAYKDNGPLLDMILGR